MNSPPPTNVVTLVPRKQELQAVRSPVEGVQSVTPVSDLDQKRVQKALDEKVKPLLVHEVGRWVYYASLGHKYTFVSTDFVNLPNKDVMVVAKSMDRILTHYGISCAKIVPNDKMRTVTVQLQREDYDKFVSQVRREYGQLPKM